MKMKKKSILEKSFFRQKWRSDRIASEEICISETKQNVLWRKNKKILFLLILFFF
jgi:hypothetical protein